MNSRGFLSEGVVGNPTLEKAITPPTDRQPREERRHKCAATAERVFGHSRECLGCGDSGGEARGDASGLESHRHGRLAPRPLDRSSPTVSDVQLQHHRQTNI